ncbi:MAG: FeoC-like transcriptional regulator [Candidatus Villigracilaceae bacterium]
MLEEILTAVRAGGTIEINALAERFHTTPELVAAMVEHLQRTGYLHPYQTCSQTCSKCSLQHVCQAKGHGGVRLWQQRG